MQHPHRMQDGGVLLIVKERDQKRRTFSEIAFRFNHATMRFGNRFR